VTPFARRVALSACTLATLAFGFGARVSAQTPAPSASAAPECTPRAATLGGIGRASVVTFRGPVFGGTVCAIVASVIADAFTARIGDAPADGALAVASTGTGGGVSVPLGGTTLTGVGPYVVAPGGTIPSFGTDTSEAPRVVLAFSGSRVVLIGTSAVSLVDLARIFRTQPEIFGADAIERAVVLASGDAATLALHTADGWIGVTPAAGHVLSVLKTP